MRHYSTKVKEQARSFLSEGLSPKEVGEIIGVDQRIIRSWNSRNWGVKVKRYKRFPDKDGKRRCDTCKEHK